MTLWVNGVGWKMLKQVQHDLYFIICAVLRVHEHRALLFMRYAPKVVSLFYFLFFFFHAFSLSRISLVHAFSLGAYLLCTLFVRALSLVHAFSLGAYLPRTLPLVHSGSLSYTFSLWARTRYTPTRRNLYLCKSYKRVLSLGAYLPRQSR